MARPPDKGKVSLEGVNVAIVDDDAGVRVAYGDLIGSYGIETRLFGSAEEFLNSADGIDFPCLILDQRLPGMWGTDLQTVLKDAAPQVPIIFVTSQNDPATRQKAMANGARFFLVKPIDEHDLMHAVSNVLGLPDPSIED